MIEFVQYKQIIENCYNIISEELYDNNDNKIPIACRLTEICDNSDTSHVCIACNFANDTNRLKNYLNTLNELNNKKDFICDEEHIIHNFEIYFMILNLIIERVRFVKKIIFNNTEDKEIENKFIFDNKFVLKKHNKVTIFEQIKRWANFVKHPKYFIFTHHPEYVCSKLECSCEEKENIINDRFVIDYYKQEDGNQKQDLIGKLKNRDDIIVEFPNFEKLTENFCKAYNNFINMIIENPVYKYKLSSNCIIEDYWQYDENS